MASQSRKTYAQRGDSHHHPVVKKLLDIAESKKSNLVISADLEDTAALLKYLGPYIAVFKTHIDVVRDFGDDTIQGLKALALKHNFIIFEDRKLVDIDNTVQKQYHNGALRISEWADIVNLEMTSKGSLATGSYIQQCIEVARKYSQSTIRFVATQAIATDPNESTTSSEDLFVFTTGINMKSSGDKLGQQYQTPADAVRRGADFIIAGRGIYASANPVDLAKEYQEQGWRAYLQRVDLP
ncbi:Orotidine 5'-phosphate decarboxylase [Akanthomyces lecanii RCEF 1005]|uniref:Orotidine 5'-phosphate decarboxylase n=1 Tax=Akanthomyces lecanii RCEF 1005 TaxID=1081108 RepID=A0A168FW68_CORDF|nr:Orotidine 5'-phosphate decarboxylase [Akanthomyces lecanii RCEF 1005]